MPMLGWRKPRICKKCGNRDETNFYHSRANECKICLSERTSNRQRGNHALHSKRHLRRAYRMTPDDIQAMLGQQGGRCAVCSKPFGDEKPMVDHNHENHQIRGLVHRFCNSLLGFAQEDETILLAAVDYLRRHRTEIGSKGEVP